LERAAADHDAAAHAGAEDHAEDDARAGRGAVGGLGEREAVGVVGDAHRAPEPRFEILPERPPVEPSGIAVADEPGRRRDRARSADADRAARAELGLGGGDEPADRLDGAGIIFARRRDAPAQQLALAAALARAERHDLDLGPAEVDAEARAQLWIG